VNVTTASQHQSVRLTGLSGLVSAGGEIIYEVEVGGDVRSGSFTTAVTPGAPFAFVVYGDNRSSVPQHTAVVDAILSEPVPLRFVVSSGDMVSDGQNESHWDSFFEIEAPLLAQLPIYTVIGNHEVDGDNWDVTERIFEQPTTVSPASGSESYYHVVYGNVEIIVLDGYLNTLYRLGSVTWPGGQEEWLEEVLDDPPAGVEHRFVVIHMGPYTSKSGRNGEYWLRFWLDDFRSAGVNAIISGHDHYAERGWTGNGILYFIHGGGGAPLYDTLGPRQTLDHTIVHSESQLGYLLVEIDGPMAELTIKGIDGEVVDYVAYGDPAQPECVTTPNCDAVAEPELMCNGGDLECINGLCSPTCPADVDDIVGCLSDDECESELGASCPGDAYCDQPGEIWEVWTFHCRCDTNECDGAIDCEGREPPVPGCVGTWDCVDEGVCEFTPSNGICTQPSDDGAPDGGAGDPGTGDAASGDAATGGDSMSSGDATGAAAPDGGCQCNGAGGVGPVTLLLLLWRRRRRT